MSGSTPADVIRELGERYNGNLVELIGREIRCVDWDKYGENWLP